MNIILENIGRRFNREWIFKGVDYSFNHTDRYAILGPNGSGKSTLLQILNGSLTPSAGTIKYNYNGQIIEEDKAFGYLSMAAPYLELIEEFSLNEMVDFHFKFKSYRVGMDKTAVAEILNLSGSKNKLIKYFSSGMKQRLKLTLAFCSDTPMLMLDEPTSNLDTQGIDWYLSLVEKFSVNRLTIVCSNQEHEYGFCNKFLDITDYK
ncbi:ABC transporter ATP-binding protein [Mucilaginibacter segetis]|uniref:ATP-binding cassette domain-containing protein n=1 Tax=Mucilaginibacter segetis TaxID=2793071 RepID=A0A934PV95_9SPHI|nr:ATP-binding cassette domain-containing protein [Mucilaginibacter segetis]MBK0380191.1 ATP-binding cassette domain-containing protein [Mucilaginibacter segetis]